MTGFKIAEGKADLNQAMFDITHGLYIMTAKLEKFNGQCVDSVMQITNTPTRIATCICKRSLTYEMVNETGQFVINAINKLDPDWMEKVKHYGLQSGRNIDKFANVKYELGELGLPILPDAKAFYECIIVPEMSLDEGTHTLFVADVISAGSHEQGESLTYNEYRNIKFKRKC